MRKFLFLLAACLVLGTSLPARAYEYVFDMSKCKDTRTVTAANHVLYTMTYENGATITLDVTPTSSDYLDRIQVNDENKLVVPFLSRISIRVQDGYNMRMAWIGAITSNYNTSTDEVLHGGVTEANVHDMHNIVTGSTSDHLFVAGMNTSAATKITGTYFRTGSNEFARTSGYDQDYYLGPIFRIWSEGTSLEDLVKADNSVREQTHMIDHDLVGVAVKTVNYQQYLMARSVEQLSPEYRQTMRADQESFKDDNGNVYEWSNPNTPQYAWIMLKVNNPEQYVGKTFNNVRGKFCDFVENPYHVFWLNPFMTVSTTPVITGDATDADKINTYPLANLVLPKDDHYFLLKPSLCEVCDITDVMRSHRDHFIYVPDNNAMMPEEVKKDENGNVIDVVAKPNFYVDNNLSYGQNYSYASFLDNEGVLPYAASDAKLLNGQTYSFDWQLYDKVYDFPSSVIVAAHHGDKDEYVYPLEIPNNTYTQSVTRPVINIVGEGELQAYNSDFFVSNQNYWSRYKYGENRNAYRNDITFTFSKPVTSNKDFGTLSIYRCNDNGDKLAKIADLVNDPYDVKRFTVNSTEDSKKAMNEPALSNLSEEPTFHNNDVIMLGSQVGQEYVSRITFSDMFYSTLMTDADGNANLSSDYQYRIESTKNGVTSVVGYAPVYKTAKNSVSRATYTLSDVEGDTNDALTENNDVNITFTPNMAKAITKYRVYKAEQGATSVDAPYNVVDAGSIEVDDNGFLNPTFTDAITDKTYEYVPEVYTSYNANTYGCYKQVVSDALINMTEPVLTASEYTSADGSKYCLATVTINSKINNSSKDTRYLVRLWREVGGEKTLLNGQDEIVFNKKTLTSYSSIADLIDTDEAITIADVFKVNQVTAGLMAEGETADIQDVTYYATLYVKDNASEKFYVKKINMTKSGQDIPTAITTVNGSAQVESVRYYNVAGMESSKPFAGMNIVVTRYSDGTTTTTKVVK